MKQKDKIILFDIDHTLFDMGKFRSRMFVEILEKLKNEGISNLKMPNVLPPLNH